MLEIITKIIDTSLFVINGKTIFLRDILFVVGFSIFALYIKRLLTSRVAEGYIKRLYKNSSASDHIAFLLRQTLTVAVYFAIIMVVFVVFGINLTHFTIIVSALSVGLGFGLQGVVSNFISGVILIFENSLKIGDVVRLSAGQTGVVTGVNFRTTTIKTPDDIVVMVPNSQVFTGVIENLTKNNYLLFVKVKFLIGYETDAGYLKGALRQESQTVYGKEFEKEPILSVLTLDARGVEYEYKVFYDQKYKELAAGVLLLAFLERFKKDGVKMANPKIELIKQEDQK
jgi:potassium-dependent mechanosensitive channel